VIDLEGGLDHGVPTVPNQILYVYFPIYDEDLPNLAKLDGVARMGAGLGAVGSPRPVALRNGLQPLGAGRGPDPGFELGIPGPEAVARLRAVRPGALFNEVFRRPPRVTSRPPGLLRRGRKPVRRLRLRRRAPGFRKPLCRSQNGGSGSGNGPVAACQVGVSPEGSRLEPPLERDLLRRTTRYVYPVGSCIAIRNRGSTESSDVGRVGRDEVAIDVELHTGGSCDDLVLRPHIDAVAERH